VQDLLHSVSYSHIDWLVNASSIIPHLSSAEPGVQLAPPVLLQNPCEFLPISILTQMSSCEQMNELLVLHHRGRQHLRIDLMQIRVKVKKHRERWSHAEGSVETVPSAQITPQSPSRVWSHATQTPAEIASSGCLGLRSRDLAPALRLTGGCRMAGSS